ncbi:hypothetical protein PILCRDRAFT_609515 [Piloderma croceum F 1598]|uniref:C2H2-type domain-containing protein n=1 Tax=Piloderma croceum (strain F 1598) TaxID=765440 RepID=A0A0C3EZ17_PILCF|nr:hypothetical protein PILCRDRAFT_609515 [Piloderma croceum F 1598]
MDPLLQMSPITMGHTYANSEQPANPYGVYTFPPSGETVNHFLSRPTMSSSRPVQPYNTAAASAQAMVHGESPPTPARYVSQAEQVVAQHGPSLPRHHYLPPPLPAGNSLASPFADVRPAFVTREMQPDGLTMPTFQMQNFVNHPLPPSTYTSVTDAVSATPTRQRPKKRTPECEKHSRMCGWNSTCTVKVHPDNVRDHLRAHMEDVGNVNAHCRYAGCNKVLRKDGLVRHYLTHFGARVECCGCKKDFARPDEITRGHRTKDKIRCSSRRWRRFIVDDNGGRNYI